MLHGSSWVPLGSAGALGLKCTDTMGCNLGHITCIHSHMYLFSHKSTCAYACVLVIHTVLLPLAMYNKINRRLFDAALMTPHTYKKSRPVPKNDENVEHYKQLGITTSVALLCICACLQCNPMAVCINSVGLVVPHCSYGSWKTEIHTDAQAASSEHNVV